MNEADVLDVFDKNRYNTGCWRTRVPAPAAEWLSAMEAHMEATGQTPEWAKVARKLKGFGVDKTSSTISRHYAGGCSCE